MSVDFKAIADALAVRFSSTYITAPSGESAISLSTASLPNAIAEERTALVFPASEVDLEYPPSARKGIALYPVRFYLYKVRDTPRNTELLNEWLTKLLPALDGQAQLGLSSYVNWAQVVHAEIGPLTYGQIEFHGIELTVAVHFGYGVSFTA